ncbi:hypothetical protein D3C80_1591540 [compost metagenome]
MVADRHPLFIRITDRPGVMADILANEQKIRRYAFLHKNIHELFGVARRAVIKG